MSKLESLYLQALRAAKERNTGIAPRLGSSGGKFYVAMNLYEGYPGGRFYSERGAQQLGKGVLDGVSGISTSREIIVQFFGVARDVLLVMDESAVRRANSVACIQYDNPEYLASRNLEVLMRIFQATSDRLSERYSHVIGRVVEYIGRAMKEDGHNLVASMLMHDAGWQKIAWAVKDAVEAGIRPRLSGVARLASYLRKMAIEHYSKADRYTSGADGRRIATETTEEDWRRWTKQALINIGKSYQDEAECLIKDKRLHVPRGSYLYIILPVRAKFYRDYKTGNLGNPKAIFYPKDDIAKVEHYEKLIRENGLRERYRVFLAFDDKIDVGKRRLLQARDLARKVNKMKKVSA